MNSALYLLFITLLALAATIPAHAGGIMSLLIPATPFEKIARRAKHFPEIMRCTFVPEEPPIDEETAEQIEAESDTKKPQAPTRNHDEEISAFVHLVTHWS